MRRRTPRCSNYNLEFLSPRWSLLWSAVASSRGNQKRATEYGPQLTRCPATRDEARRIRRISRSAGAFWKTLIISGHGHSRAFRECPLYSQKRTLPADGWMSALCQKRTLRPLERASTCIARRLPKRTRCSPNNQAFPAVACAVITMAPIPPSSKAAE